MSSLLAATEKNFNDMNLTELQEIAIRQQQQIEINQQLLLAKEKRLKYLKVEEKKNGYYLQQQQQQQQQAHLPLNSMANAENISNGANAYKLENLKQNVLSQELKIFKLKQLRNQILEHKLSNSNIYSELDLIKSLFGQKENDLYEAINKVNELSKQIEQLRKIKSISSSAAGGGAGGHQHANPTSQQQQAINANELEKLRQELQIRNKLNDQQSKKIKQQHDLFNQKQLEVMELDRRINELQTRISKKRNANQQLKLGNKPLGAGAKPSSASNGGPTSPYLADDKENGDFGVQMQELVDQNAHNVKKFAQVDQLGGGDYQQQQQAFNEQQLAQQNQQQSSSPSKVNAKFATKQEIANTYMNKFGSETYQRYHIATLRAIQQQQQQKLNTCMSPSPSSNFQQMQSGKMDENGHEMGHQGGHYGTGNPLPSSSSSSLSMSPVSMMKNQLSQQQQHQHQQHQENQYMHQAAVEQQSNALPAHLRLEFDKLKYLPDMVKTIKKRHSISEVEGSLHTVPPQVFQKLFDKHHKNNNSLNEAPSHQQQQQQLHQQQQQMNYHSMQSQQQQQQQHYQPPYPSKLNQIKETNESKANEQDVVNLGHHHQQSSNQAAMKNMANIQMIDTDETDEIEEQEVEQKLELNDQNNENEHVYESDSDKLMDESKHQHQQQRCGSEAISVTNNPTATATIYATESVQMEQKEQTTVYDEQPNTTTMTAERNIIQTALMNMSKVTKPIIKQSSLMNMDNYNGYQYQQTQILNTFASTSTKQTNAANSGENSRRVNFDPHALLLDAAVEGELELVVKCAGQVKDISEPNDEGITALHNSVCAGHFNIVEFLVKFGCDINYADNDGWTPLHCAASCNNLPMVKFLIEHGASIYATTASDNETAIKKCEEDEDGFEPCYEYLEMAQRNLGDPAYNNALVYALYNYEAQNDDELSFKCFDKLVVLNKYEDEEESHQLAENGEKVDLNDGWWLAKHVGESRQGLVPRNYLGLFPRHQPAKNTQESTIC